MLVEGGGGRSRTNSKEANSRRPLQFEIVCETRVKVLTNVSCVKSLQIIIRLNNVNATKLLEDSMAGRKVTGIPLLVLLHVDRILLLCDALSSVLNLHCKASLPAAPKQARVPPLKTTNPVLWVSVPEF